MKCRTVSGSLLAAAASAVSILFTACPSADAQIRIVDYNTAGDSRAGMGTILAAIGDEVAGGVQRPPDVLSLQEQDSSASTTQLIVNVLNGIYGAGTYARGTLDVGTTGAGRPGIIYNTKTIQLIAQTTASNTASNGAARQTLRSRLRPVGYDSAADFYVYGSHYKSSDTSSDRARRNVEAQQVRANADALGQGAHILYTGDFNIYSSSEPMWATLTAAGNGQGIDPINRVGGWSDSSSFKDVHTQSPVTSARYGGQITGGMDDRFDWQLTSGEMLDNEGISYISGTYHAFGNTNTHTFNGEITSGSATALQARLPGYTTTQAQAVLTALAGNSDHLPVVADYQLPAKMSVAVGTTPAAVIKGASVSLGVTVSNVAPVTLAAGADELDYTVSASGALTGSATGTAAAAAAAGNAHNLALDTSVAGARAGQLSVSSTSQAAADAQFTRNVAFNVLEHSNPSFAADQDDNTLEIDFGTLQLGAGTQSKPFSVTNLAAVAGFTAGLDLDAIQSAGDADVLGTSLSSFQKLIAGQGFEFDATFEPLELGQFDATYTLLFSDENLPGAAAATPLTLHLVGEVVPEPSAMASILAIAVVPFARRRARR